MLFDKHDNLVNCPGYTFVYWVDPPPDHEGSWMRKLYQTQLIALLLAHPVATTGSEQPSCDAPFVPFLDFSAEELREIAASCNDASTAMLFYNRAYHAIVMRKLRRISRLETRGGDEDEVRYEQGRIFTALAEELARIAWRPGEQDLIDDLNAAYDHSIETLEYTIKGYNLLIGKSGGGSQDKGARE